MKDLKELRESRKEKIKEIQQMVKEQKKVIERIKLALKEGPKTPPEISKETGLPSDVVMWYVASMKKYSQLAEGEKKGDYYTYLVVNGTDKT